jgi:hypothetical protein
MQASRSIVARASRPAWRLLSSPSAARMSTVAEKSVKVTFVNMEGSRVTVPGLVGQNLLEVAQMHQIELDGCCRGGGMVVGKRHSAEWTEDLVRQKPVLLFACLEVCHA